MTFNDIMEMSFTEAIAAQLAEQEAKLEELKSARSARTLEGMRDISLVVGYIRGLHAALEIERNCKKAPNAESQRWINTLLEENHSLRRIVSHMPEVQE